MINDVIKGYLDNKGIKYSRISEKLGVHNSAFSAMLNGKRKIEVQEYFLICEALDVQPNFFYGMIRDNNNDQAS